MTAKTTLFRARVPAQRLKKAEAILSRLGLNADEAVNMFLAQIEIRKGMPFEVSTNPSAMLTADQQATEWKNALGAY